MFTFYKRQALPEPSPSPHTPATVNSDREMKSRGGPDSHLAAKTRQQLSYRVASHFLPHLLSSTPFYALRCAPYGRPPFALYRQGSRHSSYEAGGTLQRKGGREGLWGVRNSYYNNNFIELAWALQGLDNRRKSHVRSYIALRAIALNQNEGPELNPYFQNRGSEVKLVHGRQAMKGPKGESDTRRNGRQAIGLEPIPPWGLRAFGPSAASLRLPPCGPAVLQKFINLCMKHGKKEGSAQIISNTLRRLSLSEGPLWRSRSDAKKRTSEASATRGTFYEPSASDLTSPLALLLLMNAIENVKPIIEVKKVRISGTTQLVPSIIKPNRQICLAIRWIVEAAISRRNAKKSLTLDQCFFAELVDASKNIGTVRLRRDDLHKLAESNRGFAHYRWWA